MGNYLAPFTRDKVRHSYELYAVSNHMGSLGGGHYTAYCKENSKWYCFDDVRVSQVDSRRIISAEAYVLYFVRKDGTLREELESSSGDDSSSLSGEDYT